MTRAPPDSAGAGIPHSGGDGGCVPVSFSGAGSPPVLGRRVAGAPGMGGAPSGSLGWVPATLGESYKFMIVSPGRRLHLPLPSPPGGIWVFCTLGLGPFGCPGEVGMRPAEAFSAGATRRAGSLAWGRPARRQAHRRERVSYRAKMNMFFMMSCILASPGSHGCWQFNSSRFVVFSRIFGMLFKRPNTFFRRLGSGALAACGCKHFASTIRN